MTPSSTLLVWTTAAGIGVVATQEHPDIREVTAACRAGSRRTSSESFTMAGAARVAASDFTMHPFSDRWVIEARFPRAAIVRRVHGPRSKRSSDRRS